MDNGTKLVDQAGATISALVGDVKRVSGLMGSIAEASAEQSRGVQQVNKTVTEMDKVVQQNASAVQQSAAAADAMRLQAEALLRAVSTFRIGNGAAPAARAAARGLARPRAGPRSGRHPPPRVRSRDRRATLRRRRPRAHRASRAATTGKNSDMKEQACGPLKGRP